MAVSADVLARSVDDGSWDSKVFAPALELLDVVVAGYNSSAAGVIGRDDMGEEAANT